MLGPQSQGGLTYGLLDTLGVDVRQLLEQALQELSYLQGGMQLQTGPRPLSSW